MGYLEYTYTTAQARSYQVDEILDPGYKPRGVEETLVFEEKQKYVFAVFTNILLTGKGKALI